MDQEQIVAEFEKMEKMLREAREAASAGYLDRALRLVAQVGGKTDALMRVLARNVQQQKAETPSSQ